jgi:hypothetical protein
VNSVSKFVFAGGAMLFGYWEVGSEKLNIIRANVVLERVDKVF